MGPTVDREKAAALYEAMVKAQNEFEEADNNCGSDAAVNEKFEKLDDEMRDRHDKEREALEAQRRAAHGLEELEAKKDAAKAAYNDESVPAVRTTWDDEGDDRIIVRCAKSNKPILEDEETVTVEETGEVFLRSELGLPPHEEPAEEVEKAA